MRILVLSDTHVPRMVSDIPKAIYDEIGRSDLILHAGDFTDIGFYKKLLKMKRMIGVCGNMDAKEVSSLLKPKEVVRAGKFTIGLIHGWGPPEGLIERISAEFEPEMPDCIVFGHSHKPFNEKIGKVLFFNPGSATDKVFAPYNSYGIIEAGDKLTAEIIKL